MIVPVKMNGNILYDDKHHEDESSGIDWSIFTRPTFLKKKTVEPSKKNGVLDYFPDLLKKNKVAVVLSGGGAKGLAHVGILKELNKYDVNVDFISGTSMGAILAAVYALEGDLDLVDRHLKHRARDLVTLKDFSLSLKGMIKGIVIQDILRNLYGDATFEDTKIDLAINAVDIESGKEVIFRHGKIIDAVRASMSIPIVFSPKTINGRMYVDGGLVNNIPYNVVPKKYKKVIISDVNSQIPLLKKKYTGIEYFYHVISLLEHNAMKVPDDKRIMWLRPDMKDIGVGDFGKMKDAVERGRAEAERVLPKKFKKIK